MNNSCFKRSQNVRRLRKSFSGETVPGMKRQQSSYKLNAKRRASELHGPVKRICEEDSDKFSIESYDYPEEDSFDGQQNDTHIQEIWSGKEISRTLQEMPGGVEITTNLIARDIADCCTHAYAETTGILIASWLGRGGFLEEVMKKNPPLDVRDSHGRTALHLAATAGNIECVRILLENGANPNVWDSGCLVTPLHCAANCDALGCLKLLIESGANINACVTSTGSGKLPLYYAVQSNAISCLQELLKQGACPNTSQVYSEAPLHLAASLGFAKCVKLLLENGADIRARYGIGKSTPLHLAAQDGNAECAHLLLKAGADNKAKTNKEQTALHLAALAQSAKTLEILLQHNADPNAMDVDNRTPLHCAIAGKGSRTWEPVQLLLKHGANVNAADRFGYTPVHLAALNECPNSLKLFIDSGADVTIKTKGNVSALSFIARRSPEILRYIESKLDDAIQLYDHEIGDVDCEIKLDFRFLAPDIWTGETGLLLSFVEVGERRLLRHPLCEVFLYLKWLKIRKFFVISLILHALYAILCSIYILNNSNEDDHQLSKPFAILNIFLLITTILILMKEIFQVAHGWKKYMTHWENWLEWLIILTVFIVLIPKSWLPQDVIIYQNHITVYSIFFNWIELMVLMGRFPMFGLYVQMFTTGAINFGKFLLAYCAILLAFASAFRITFPHYDAFEDIAISLVKTIVMMTGELEFEDIFFPQQKARGLFKPNRNVLYPGTSHLFFLLFTLMVTTVLTNLLVGLSVSDIQGLHRSARLDRLVRQVELVAYMESTLFSSLFSWIPKPLMSILKKNATLLSSARQWTLIIRPNDPREKRIPAVLIKAVYACVAERREKSNKPKREKSIPKKNDFVKKSYQ